jgi:hypothetical protein
VCISKCLLKIQKTHKYVLITYYSLLITIIIFLSLSPIPCDIQSYQRVTAIIALRDDLSACDMNSKDLELVFFSLASLARWLVLVHKLYQPHGELLR